MVLFSYFQNPRPLLSRFLSCPKPFFRNWSLTELKFLFQTIAFFQLYGATHSNGSLIAIFFSPVILFPLTRTVKFCIRVREICQGCPWTFWKIGNNMASKSQIYYFPWNSFNIGTFLSNLWNFSSFADILVVYEAEDAFISRAVFEQEYERALKIICVFFKETWTISSFQYIVMSMERF